MENKQVMNRQTSSKELHLISCGWEKCTPEQSYGPGVRRYYTIHFVLSGQGYFYMNNRKYTLKAGQCFFIPPVTSSLYKAEPSNPWTYIWICFNGENAPTLCEHCHLTGETPVQQLDSVLPYRETILEMMSHPQLTPSGEAYIQSGLYRIIALLEEEFHACYTTMESNDNFYITQAVDYIKKSPLQDITVTDVADYLHISRSHLYGLFKKHLGTTPQAFLTSAKIINARDLLTITDIPVSSVAISCGYQNPFAFSRAFKKETGMTPREYREKYHHAEDLLDCLTTFPDLRNNYLGIVIFYCGIHGRTFVVKPVISDGFAVFSPYLRAVDLFPVKRNKMLFLF